MTKNDFYVCFWQYDDIICSPLLQCKTNGINKMQYIFNTELFLSVVKDELIHHISNNVKAIRHFEAFKTYLTSEICASQETALLIDFVMHFMENKINQFHPILNENTQFKILNNTKNIHLLFKPLEGIFNAFHNTSLANNFGRIDSSLKSLINADEYYILYISTHRSRTFFQRLFHSEPDFIGSYFYAMNKVTKIVGNSKELNISFENTPYTLMININGSISLLENQ